VIGRDDHVRGTEQSVRARRKDFQPPLVGFKLNFSPFASSDPIALKKLYRFRPIQSFKIIN
jgi:hypothetical protein